MSRRMAAAQDRISVTGSKAGRSVATALLVMTALWAMSVVTAPYLASHARSSDAALHAAVVPYLFGSVICHQQAERSFHANGTQWPVCARCAGLYLLAPFGVVWALVTRPPRPQRTSALRVALLAAALPTIVTVFVEAADLYQPTNLVRAVAAMPLGFTTAWLLGRFTRGPLAGC